MSGLPLDVSESSLEVIDLLRCEGGFTALEAGE
jgi:hypothetical protein